MELGKKIIRKRGYVQNDCGSGKSGITALVQAHVFQSDFPSERVANNRVDRNMFRLKRIVNIQRYVFHGVCAWHSRGVPVTAQINCENLEVRMGQLGNIILGMSRKNPTVLESCFRDYSFTKFPQFRLFPTHESRSREFTHDSVQKQHIFRPVIVVFGHGESCHAAHYFSQF